MSRQVVFVQGAGPQVHDDWDEKLAASLRAATTSEVELRYPRMPDEAEPHYASWATALEQEIAELAAGAVVVGHSMGGTFLIHAIAQHPPRRELGAIVLIAAPFVGEGGWPSDGWTPTRELGEVLPRAVPVFLYHGLADTTVPASHASLYARAIPWATLRLLPGRDHQLNNDLSEVAAVIDALATG